VALLVLKSHTKKSPEEVVDEVIKMVREKIGPIASFRSAAVVDHLPKTRSGMLINILPSISWVTDPGRQFCRESAALDAEKDCRW
jgi:hypothetical protein